MKLTPVARLVLQFGVNPAVGHGSLRISLGKAERLHGLVLAVALTALDADMLGFEVFLVLKDQPTILVPERDALVHAVVPGLQTLDRALRRAPKHGSKVLLDALPLELLVVPKVDDEVTFLSSILLVDVSVLAIGRRAGIAFKTQVGTLHVGVAHGSVSGGR